MHAVRRLLEQEYKILLQRDSFMHALRDVDSIAFVGPKKEALSRLHNRGNLFLSRFHRPPLPSY